MGKHGEPTGHWLTRRPPTLLDDAYCNALLLAHWSVRQKLNHINSVQLRYVTRLYANVVVQIRCFIKRTPFVFFFIGPNLLK